VTTHDFDDDWIVIGSGFGGSVSALRLAEKGYRVSVLECGRRFRDEDFAESTWDARRYFWAPMLGMKGILRLSPMKDMFIGSGCGVGGGSLGYASTLYRARPEFFKDPQWADLDDWEAVLAPCYDTAEHYLGVEPVDFDSDGDELLRQLGAHLGVADTFAHTRVGIFLGEPGKTVPDPYFDGEGPERTGCIRCGSCMVGCRHGAKNTLVKNYLYLAEKKGVRVEAERTVVDVRPLGDGDGSEGYAVTTVRSGAWFARDRRVRTARGVVVAAGAMGTNHLLANCKHHGSLPRLSDRLGELVRSNSESILAVTPEEDHHDFTKTVAISSSIYPDHDTHIELVTYGPDADSMSFLFLLLTGHGTRLTRPFLALATAIRHPIRFLKSLWPFKWSRRTLIVLVMQTSDNAIRFCARRRWLRGGVRLTTQQDPERPIPTEIPVADEAVRWLVEKIGGIPQASVLESVFNIPSTAHILGGAPIGEDATKGVVDRHLRAFGYQNLVVCDGAAVPANPGVNPSLTITALAEHAMRQIPVADGLTGPGMSGGG
jgi:cholesterol oxidase